MLSFQRMSVSHHLSRSQCSSTRVLFKSVCLLAWMVRKILRKILRSYVRPSILRSA
jgi:hypothetical protein